MKQLNNTLYVTTLDTYLSLDGENIVIRKDDEELKRVPLHNIESIITFGYTGASPALMGICAKRNIALTFMSYHGHFLARISGEQNGNVLLRKEQYRISDDLEESLMIAKNMITGKVYNAKWVLERVIRDYAMRIDTDNLTAVSKQLSSALIEIRNAKYAAELLGIEGKAAELYFSVFDDMILQQKTDFQFNGRSKRPPKDYVNALLSFAYTLLAHDCASALESVGLDSYVGFYHKDRSGRISLALDLMEEFRSIMVDRFVLTLINKKVITKSDFWIKENGAVILKEDARRTFLGAWQKKKNDIITHPYLNEKMAWGLAPFAQAQLLARYLRKDIDEYPPFFWK